MDNRRYLKLAAIVVLSTALLFVIAVTNQMVFDFAQWSPSNTEKWRDGAAMLFNLLVVTTLHYFIAGLVVSFAFGRTGMTTSIMVAIVFAVAVDRISATGREELIQWSLVYIRVATATLGAVAGQALRAAYKRLRMRASPTDRAVTES
ncbi:MAG: hypothetical protein L0Z53_18975 [Acidobacteriales bacterium]|nr:hypothetical protein [Terriglobales bacterium]